MHTLLVKIEKARQVDYEMRVIMFTSSSLEGKGKYCTGKVNNNNQIQTIPTLTLITVKKKKISKCKTGLLD